MTYEQEENIMGWMLIAIAILSIVAIINATPTPSTQTRHASTHIDYRQPYGYGHLHSLLTGQGTKYDNETDTTHKPIRTGHIHQATPSQ